MNSYVFLTDEQSEYIPLGEDDEVVSPHEGGDKSATVMQECSSHDRLRVIEHPLVELQKYLDTVILFYARCPEGRLRVLTASVTYFKGVPGDMAHCLIPAQGLCLWGAVERITKSS